MLMQHYHTSTNLSRKLDASLRYLQLQLGTPHNPFLLDYAVWGHLAPRTVVIWRISYLIPAAGTSHLRSGFHAKSQREKIGIDGLISGIPSQQLETNSRSPLAIGSIPHIASGNGITEKTPMTY